tara:strand:- start:886 stop:1050 length:165 start_codon:yes stop_codon:yes gene_type:complete
VLPEEVLAVAKRKENLLFHNANGLYHGENLVSAAAAGEVDLALGGLGEEDADYA